MQTKPKFKKGPVAVEVKAQIEADYLGGMTEEQLSKKYERSPDVIGKVLALLAMRPKPVARPVQAILEYNFMPVKVKTPNGCEFQLEVPVGMDSTNNTVMLEQIHKFLDGHRAAPDPKDVLKEGEK